MVVAWPWKWSKSVLSARMRKLIIWETREQVRLCILDSPPSTILVLGSTNHRFLIRLYHAFQTADALYFVMEFAQGKNYWRHRFIFSSKGGEVYTMLARSTTFPLNQCRFYGAEITCAFQYLHEVMCRFFWSVLSFFLVEGHHLPWFETGKYSSRRWWPH